MRTLKLTLVLLSVMLASITFAQDWANTARFKDENAKLAPPAKGENRVVFMGNSIT